MNIQQADTYFGSLFGQRWPENDAGVRWYNAFHKIRMSFEDKKTDIYDFSLTKHMVDHGWDHATQLYASLPRFLWAIESFSKQDDIVIIDNPAELYCLLVSAFTHDVGMNCSLSGFKRFMGDAKKPQFPFMCSKIQEWRQDWSVLEPQIRKLADPQAVRDLHPEIGAWMCETGCLPVDLPKQHRKVLAEIVFRHAKRVPKKTCARSLELDPGVPLDVRIGLIASLVAVADGCQVGISRQGGPQKQLEYLAGEIETWQSIVATTLDGPHKRHFSKRLRSLEQQQYHILKHLAIKEVSVGRHGIIVVPTGADRPLSWNESQADNKDLHLKGCPTKRDLIWDASNDILKEIKSGGCGPYLRSRFHKNIIPEVSLVTEESWRDNDKDSSEKNDKEWQTYKARWERGALTAGSMGALSRELCAYVPTEKPVVGAPTSLATQSLHAIERKIPYILPAEPAEFFGHAQLRKETVERLARPCLVVVHNTGGAGKTTFANRVAHDAIADKLFPGGAVWVDCEMHPTLESCIRKVAAVLLPKSDEGGLSTTDTVEKLACYFRHNRTLIILDSYEIAIRQQESDQELYAWLWSNRAAACFMITTTDVSEGLKNKAVVEYIPLPELDPEAAIALFKHHAEKTSPCPEEAAIISDLCKAVGYSPLAILMLGRHAQPGGLSLPDLEKQFKQDLQKVLQTDSSVLRKWHQNMGTCFRLSFQSASANERSFLGFLSIPTGGLHKVLAECYLTSIQEQGVLLGCRKRALLREEGDRYTLHPLWRAFLRSEMGAGIAEWEYPFIEFMVEEAERQKRTRPEHHQDFEAAFWLCNGKKKWELLSRLCRRIRKLPEFTYLVEAGGMQEEELEEEIDYNLTILEEIATNYVNNAKGRLCIFLAMARKLTDLTCCDGYHELWKKGFRYDVEETRWARVLELSRQVEDKEAEIEALHVLAHYHLHEGNWAKAESNLRAILDLCECCSKADTAQIESVSMHLVESLHRQEKNTEEVEALEILRDVWEKRKNHLPLPWPDDQWFHDPDSSLHYRERHSSPKGAADLFLKYARLLVALGEWPKAQKWLAMIMTVATESEKLFAAEREDRERADAAVKAANDCGDKSVIDLYEAAHKRFYEGRIKTVWEYWPWVWNLQAEHRSAPDEDEEALKGYQQIIEGGQVVRYCCKSLVPCAESFVGAAKIIAAKGDLKAALKAALQAQALQTWIDEESEWKDEPGMTKEQSLEVTLHNFRRLHLDAKDLYGIKRERGDRKRLQKILDGSEQYLRSEQSTEMPAPAPGQPDSAIRVEIRRLTRDLKERCEAKQHRQGAK